MKSYYIFLLIIPFFACQNQPQEQAVHDGDTYYNHALQYLELGKADSAYLTFDHAKDIYLQVGDTLGVASCLIQSAITMTEQGDYFGSQETSLQVLDYLNQNNKNHWHYLAMNYNNLGRATAMLKDYPQALDFAERAIAFSVDSATTQVYLNNKAATLYDFRRYHEAISIFQKVVENTAEGTVEYARVLTNLAKTKWRIDSVYDAVSDLNKALQIRQAHHDLWGQNSSYAHLTEYYEDRDSEIALRYAQKRYAVAQQLHSANDQLNGLRKLIKLSPPSEVQTYFVRYQSLQDSVQRVHTSAKNQFALIRYEVAKNKAQNLSLQKDNAIQAKNLIIQQTAIITAIVLIIGGVFYHKKRKQRLELEAQGQIKAYKLKTSRQVHDVVANGIYRVMAEIENKSEIDREGILDRLEIMYNKSRDISYTADVDTQIQSKPYYEELSESIRSYATDARRVITVGNDAETWLDIDNSIKEEMRYILQECMVNMKKHSHADNVIVKFVRSSGQLTITYRDNGVGINETTILGNGIQSMVSRINNLHGHISFDTTADKGLEIKIDIPIMQL